MTKILAFCNKKCPISGGDNLLTLLTCLGHTITWTIYINKPTHCHCHDPPNCCVESHIMDRGIMRKHFQMFTWLGPLSCLLLRSVTPFMYLHGNISSFKIMILILSTSNHWQLSPYYLIGLRLMTSMSHSYSLIVIARLFLVRIIIV